MTLVPLDAPLVHLGGITTGKWARTLKPEGPTIMSWALNNHWLVNFKASQGGRIPLRYRLTTHRGRGRSGCRGAASPPRRLCRRWCFATSRRRGRCRISSSPSIEDAPVLINAKPGEDDGWVALRVQNLLNAKASPVLTFKKKPAGARRSDPIEHPGKSLPLDGHSLRIDLDPLVVATVLVKFNPESKRSRSSKRRAKRET